MHSCLTTFVVGTAIAAAGLWACSSTDPELEKVAQDTSALRHLRKVPQAANSYTLFETLQTRPLALSLDGDLLFALNSPDNRLEVFRVHHRGLEPVSSVVVGLEPVAVRMVASSTSSTHSNRSTLPSLAWLEAVPS